MLFPCKTTSSNVVLDKKNYIHCTYWDKLIGTYLIIYQISGPEKPINKELKAVSLCQISNNNTKIDLRFISKTLEKRQQSIDKLT